ncbi:hypothetical protein EWM64_g5090 [Hericium alpestre]|uniref:J domain-containing protein n=1 Tax=Hericium alpestre TaxID=135208 RepID=A0A4Y9ZYA9_9AGAM|nr:hypothetical protein EWM64_g5090 [Hericium alpestre]
MDEANVNFYQVLGVSRTATAEDVRKAYKQKVLETHPDKLPPEVSERARQRMKDKFGLVHEAFEAYDIHNRNLPTPGSSSSVPKWTTPSEDQRRRIREREAWARQAHERSQERIRLARQAKQSQSKPAQPAPSPAPSQLQVQVQTKEAAVAQAESAETKQAEEYTAMVEAMLQELYRLSPEWEERKRRLKMRKASPPRRLHTTS